MCVFNILNTVFHLKLYFITLNALYVYIRLRLGSRLALLCSDSCPYKTKMNHKVKTMDLIHHYPSDTLQILRHAHDICPPPLKQRKINLKLFETRGLAPLTARRGIFTATHDTYSGNATSVTCKALIFTH